MAFDRKFGKELQRRLKYFGGGRLEQRLDWMEPYPVGLRIAATLAIGTSEWSELARLGASLRREATRDLNAMKAQQREWDTVWTDSQRVRAALESTWRAPGERAGWEDARKDLLREMPARGVRGAKLKAALVSFSRATTDGMMKLVEEPISWVGRQLEAGVYGRLCGLAAADLAESVARFNLLVEQRSAEGRRPTSRLASIALKRTNALLHGLHTSLRIATRSQVASKARHAEVKAEQLLEPLIRAAAYQAIHESAEFEADIGQRSIEVAEAIRAALLVRSTARAIAWDTAWPDTSTFLDKWRIAARTKSFESGFTTPPVTSLAELSSTPNGSPPELVTVEGRVGTVKIVHRGRKALSSTSLTDTSGRAVSIGLPYIKLDSGGLVGGSYARITGRYVASHSDFTGPVLVPDRRNLADDARTSWLDWLALEMSSIVTPVAHHLTAAWSWRAGPDGAANPLQYGTWSGRSREGTF